VVPMGSDAEARGRRDAGRSCGPTGDAGVDLHWSDGAQANAIGMSVPTMNTVEPVRPGEVKPGRRVPTAAVRTGRAGYAMPNRSRWRLRA
jgi:hypothetical protein